MKLEQNIYISNYVKYNEKWNRTKQTKPKGIEFSGYNAEMEQNKTYETKRNRIQQILYSEKWNRILFVGLYKKWSTRHPKTKKPRI